MIERTIEGRIKEYFESGSDKTLMITGPRQVGKTTAVRQFAEKHIDKYIELSFKEDTELKTIFTGCKDAEELLLRLSFHIKERFMEGDALLFFDSIEEMPEAVYELIGLTKISQGKFKIIIAGIPRGIDMGDLKEYHGDVFELINMNPISFKEFTMLSGITEYVYEHIMDSFKKKTPVDAYINDKMLELFYKYLVIGGMPEAVSQYLDGAGYEEIKKIHLKIISYMEEDIRVLDPKSRHYMQDIFTLIPDELCKHNKRFFMKNLGENFKFSRQKESFKVMAGAGLTNISYCVKEPEGIPSDSKAENLFKLYMPDTGLLTAIYECDTEEKLLRNKVVLNGAICENAIAQELVYQGRELYYYCSHKHGELDFLISYKGKTFPLVIKSGKEYPRHIGMYNLMHSEEYSFDMGVVLGDMNVSVHEKEYRFPIYMIGFAEDLI